MKKTVIKSALLCASLFGMAISANAADINVNITGASAQFTFWAAAAGPFLTSQGCTNVQVAKQGTTYGITRGTCAGDTVYVRYTSNASYDGIASKKGTDPFNKTSCADKYTRAFADENNAGTTWGTVAAPGVVGGTTCQQVTVGASDVAASTFNQESHGALLGPNGGAQSDFVIKGLDDSGLTIYHPIVVPFNFFKTTQVPTSNMTREMATQIFGAQVSDWNQFNPAWPSTPIVACLRHAGSGTAATLDAGVFRNEATMSTNEDSGGLFGPITYFNNGSSDEINCLRWAATQGYGGVGYADIDQVLNAGAIITNPANAVNGVMHMAYSGEYGLKNNIVNGIYDFWSAQSMYEDKCESMTTGRPTTCTGPVDPRGVAAGGKLHTWINNMMTFASSPANIALSGKGAFWAASGEMNVSKGSDFGWPHR